MKKKIIIDNYYRYKNLFNNIVYIYIIYKKFKNNN